nr:aminotransferase class V-fold PLP-dependent enzyme [Rhodothermaceae bacterium]
AYSDNGTFDIPSTLSYNETAQRYEPGTRDASTVVGMVAAVEFLQLIGMDEVEKYGQSLARYLQQHLRELPGVHVLTPSGPMLSAGITTFKIDAMPFDELYRFLSIDHKIRCRIVTERGIDAVRISTHIFNNKAECDQVVQGVREAIG